MIRISEDRTGLRIVRMRLPLKRRRNLKGRKQMRIFRLA